MTGLAGLPAIVLWAIATPAQPADPFHITAAEKAACTEDAMRLCADTYPDEGRLLICMKGNRSLLGPACLKALDTGLKRRGL